MSNPITLLRERAGLTRSQMAKAFGCSYCDVCAAETGRSQSIPRGVIAGLVRLGYPVDSIKNDYCAWLLSEREALRPLATPGARPAATPAVLTR